MTSQAFVAGLFVLSTLSTASLSSAQAEVDMAKEVEFLRGLAKDWGFVELAQGRLGELRRSATTSDETQRLLAQINAEVLYLGARRIRDLNKRKAVLSEALQKFDDYLSQYGRDQGASAVLSAQAEACEYYGSFLSRAIELERDPDKTKELEEESLNVFMKGIKASNDAMANLEGRKDDNPRAKVDYYLSWMRKGTLLREWAKTVRKDREVKATEAIETLEGLALEIGEETPIGIKALLEMGVAMDVQGKTADALDTYQGTIEIVVERCQSTQNPIPLGTQGLLFRFLEESYVFLTDIFLREGQLDETIAAVDAYQRQRADLDLPSNPQFADSILLNGAQARLDKGGKENVDRALAVAKDVANRHPSDFVGLKARATISSILNRPGVEISAEALAQAAQGEFDSKNYDAAIRSYKRVLRSLESAEDKQKYGLRAYAQIGLAFALRDRFLEAGEAFKEGLRRYGRLTADKSVPPKVVKMLNKAVRGLGRQKKDKEFVAKLKREADDAAVKFGGEEIKGEVFFVQARSMIDNGQYVEAIQNLEGIDRSVPQYEIARTMIGFAYWKKGDLDNARKVLGNYLTYVKDPLNDIRPPKEHEKRQYRDMAVADAQFYLGMMLADEAYGKFGKPQPQKKKDVVRAFRNYGKQYGQVRKAWAVRGAYWLVKALVDLERLSEGETEYAALRKQFPNEPLLANLAIVLFNARDTNVAAIEEEIKALEKNVTKARELRDAKQRRRTEIRKALSFATNYLAIEREPDYGLLRNASKLAGGIQDWGQAEFFLEKILALYGKNREYTQKIDSFIKPELAEIKMQKNDFRAAQTLIEDALKAQPNSYSLLKLKTRVLGGWCEFDEAGNFRRPQGLGEFRQAYDLLFQEYGKYVRSKFDKYSFEWYQFQFDCLDMADKLATKNSDFMRAARRFYRIAQSTDDFTTLKNFGQQGQRLHLLFQKLKR